MAISDELAFLVYKATRHFPKEEVWGLISQMRRGRQYFSPCKYSGGIGKESHEEYLQFLYTAMGSLTELGDLH